MKPRKKLYPQSSSKTFATKVKRVFVAIILIFLFFSLSKNLFDYRKTINFYEGFKQDYEKETKRKIELKTNILKSKDPYEIEKILRNKLNLLKDGEIAIIIPNPTPTPKQAKQADMPIYRQWAEALF